MNDAFGRPQTVLVVGGRSDIAAATIEALGPTVARLALAVRGGGTDPSDSISPDTVGGPDPGSGASADGPVVRTFDFDAADGARHQAMVDEAAAWLGGIDLALIAHGDLGAPFDLDVDAAEVARLIDVNGAGAASVVHAVARRVAHQGHGTVVVLSSVAAVRPRRANLAYAAAKAALDGYALGLDAVLADSGARVMVVRPGFVHTKMTEGRPAQPLATDGAAVADAIVDGLARGRRVVWVPASLRLLAPLLRFVPESLWRRISAR